MNPELLEYIRANRDTYPRETIDAELRREGHSERETEAAWTALQDEDASSVWSLRCGLVLLYFVLTLVGIMILGLANLDLGNGNSGPLIWIIDLGSLVVLVGAVALGSWLRKVKKWPGNRVIALIVVTILVWFAVVAEVVNRSQGHGWSF